MGKMRKLPFKSKDSYMSSRPLEIIHSDIGGPIMPATREGYRYWITFIDRHTRFTWVRLIKRKSDAQAAYTQWRNDVLLYFRAEVGHVFFSPNWLHFLRTDGGGEYTGKAFEEQLRLRYFSRDYRCRHTRAERLGRAYKWDHCYPCACHAH